MKKLKYLIFTIMLFLICISNTYAACTQEEIDNFKKVEDEYTTRYEINKNTKKYDVYFNSSQPDKYNYVIYSGEELKCTDPDENTLKCSGFTNGEYNVIIVGVTTSCNEILKEMKLKLPKYNELSEDPLCKGIEEFVLCNPTYEKEIDYENFVSRVNTYKRTKEQKEEVEQKEEQTTTNKVLEYISDNLIQIIIIITFIVLLTITAIITANSIRKSRRLE